MSTTSTATGRGATGTSTNGTGRLKGRSPLAKGAGFLEEFSKDEIKKKINIITLMESFGIRLEKKGSSYMGLCPFHDDKTPSLSVDQAKGLYHCFGCGEGGDVFDLVMRTRSIDFPAALEFLKGFNGTVHPSSSPPALNRSHLSSISLTDVISAYRKDLEASDDARDYLKERGLLHPEILGRLEIGFCKGTIKEKTSGEQQRILKSMGLFNSKGTEHFYQCITFPLRNLQNQPLSLYGRRTSKRTPKHLYLRGPHQGLFNPAAYSVYPDGMIWTESIIDAMSLLVLGYQNVDALYGTGGLSEAHVQALKESRTQKIILAFDNDEAGRKGAHQMVNTIQELGPWVSTIFPPESVGDRPCKDWNDFLLGVGPDGKEGGKKLIDDLIKEALQANPASPSPSSLKITKKNDRYTATRGLATSGGVNKDAISYTIIGVKEGFITSLKVNIRATFQNRKFIDNVDLFSARSRSFFASGLSRLFDIESAGVEKDLVDILEHLEGDTNPQSGLEDDGTLLPLSPEEKSQALAFLTDPNLFDRIEEDLEELGYVGEAVNKRLMYLAASSRKTESPISIILTSQSAAGKSFLIDTVKKLMPPEEVLSMTSLSDQALNYTEDEALLYKFLTLGESVHSEAVEYQLREMLSGGELSRLVTTKDEKSGKMVSRMVRKKVIVAMVMSTTSSDINQENASRSFLISTDETISQTQAIHRRQREKYSYEAYQRKEQAVPAIIARHQVAQRLLEKRKIINPFAAHLDFPSKQMRSRRDHERFIDLIAAVCFLRQYQKPPVPVDGATGALTSDGSTFIECDIQDYRIAHQIMCAILPSTLGELPSSAQRLIDETKILIESRAKKLNLSPDEIWITQRDLREHTGLGHDLIKKNLRILIDWEYLKGRGQARGMRCRYSLGAPFSPSVNLLPTPKEIEKYMEKSGARPLKHDKYRQDKE